MTNCFRDLTELYHLRAKETEGIWMFAGLDGEMIWEKPEGGHFQISIALIQIAGR
jgi:hypothetical protein